MKVTVTEQQLRDHQRATYRGALEGTAVGATTAAIGTYLVSRRYPGYRALPPSLKVLGALLITAPALAIQAERRGLEYDRSQWTDEGARVLEDRADREEARRSALTTGGRMADWAERHQFGIILGGWATGIAVAGSIIAKNPYQTAPQKIVQTRMWAQGITILLVIGGAVLQAQRRKPVDEADHSWMDVLAERERIKREEGLRATEPRTVIHHHQS